MVAWFGVSRPVSRRDVAPLSAPECEQRRDHQAGLRHQQFGRLLDDRAARRREGRRRAARCRNRVPDHRRRHRRRAAAHRRRPADQGGGRDRDFPGRSAEPDRADRRCREARPGVHAGQRRSAVGAHAATSAPTTSRPAGRPVSSFARRSPTAARSCCSSASSTRRTRRSGCRESRRRSTGSNDPHHRRADR